MFIFIVLCTKSHCENENGKLLFIINIIIFIIILDFIN